MKAHGSEPWEAGMDIVGIAVGRFSQALSGGQDGADYLTDFIREHRLTDDEVLVLVYYAASIVSRRAERTAS